MSEKEEMSVTEMKSLKLVMEENISAEINKFQRKTGLRVDRLDCEVLQSMGQAPMVLCSAVVKL